jgi:hypothetical protein
VHTRGCFETCILVYHLYTTHFRTVPKLRVRQLNFYLILRPHGVARNKPYKDIGYKLRLLPHSIRSVCCEKNILRQFIMGVAGAECGLLNIKPGGTYRTHNAVGGYAQEPCFSHLTGSTGWGG